MKLLIRLLLCLLILPNEVLASNKPLHFALLLAQHEQDPFWGAVNSFAMQAGIQLDIKLSIFHSYDANRQILQFIEKAKEINADAAIFPSIEQSGLHLIQEAEKHQLPILLFNSDILANHKLALGQPQDKYKYWLASLMPDDYQAGYILAKTLIKQAKQKGLTDLNGDVQITAINGDMDSSPAQQRLAGLHKAISEDDSTNLLRSVDTDWRKKTASNKAHRLYKHYPNATVYWAASDLIAIAVEETLSEYNLKQGQDYLTGGVDWSEKGLKAIKNNLISTSAGGHFMDGAWAVIMLYDHFNGYPIQGETSFEFFSPMSLIAEKDIDILTPHLSNHDWQSIDFRSRSKAINQQLMEYNFSPASVLSELRQNQQ